MGMQTLAAALEREHREIDAGIESFTSGSRAGDVLDLLEREIVTASHGETALKVCRQLTDMLSPHHRKEEEVLYAAADELLTRAAEVRLRGFLAYARLPAGWSCEMAQQSHSHSHASAVPLFHSRDC